MRKRLIATIVLGVALLFSQVATVLVAALCPHLRSPAASCFTEMSAPATSHEHMDHMQMDHGESEPVVNENDEGVALGQPVKACPHCAMHSRSSSNPVSLRETKTAKRASDLNIPAAVEQVLSERPPSSSLVISRAHGPPGGLIPRHILIKIFRI